MSQKPIFGRQSMIYAIWAIAILGFLVWAHHMFTSGMPDWLRIFMSFTTVLIAVPTGIKIFNWLATLHKGAIRFNTPMLFTLGGIFMFLIGGLTGVPLALPAFDIHVHDSAFVVGHFHYVLGMAVSLAAFSGIYFWYPKMFGRMMNEPLGKIHFFLTFLFMNGTFYLMHILGARGFPRRLADPYDYETFANLQPMNQFMSICAIGMVAVQVIFAFNFFYSIFFGTRVGRNPWRSNGLEWTAPSPPLGLSRSRGRRGLERDPGCRLGPDRRTTQVTRGRGLPAGSRARRLRGWESRGRTPRSSPSFRRLRLRRRRRPLP